MKAATVVFAGGVAAAVVLAGVVVYELAHTEGAPIAGLELPDVSLPAIKLKVPGVDCGKAKPLTAPTLAQFLDYAGTMARGWQPDAQLERLDNLAMQGPLRADGSSTKWTAGYHSSAAKAGMLVHTGDGQVYCSSRADPNESRIPKLPASYMRDGAALYRLAEKHNKANLAKGLGVGITLWTSADDNHAAWRVGVYDKEGYPKGPTVVVNAINGNVEAVEK